MLFRRYAEEKVPLFLPIPADVKIIQNPRWKIKGGVSGICGRICENHLTTGAAARTIGEKEAMVMFSSEPRCIYAKSPLVEVICQVRFPEISEINVVEPTAFREAVSGAFPKFSARMEHPSKIRVEDGKPVTETANVMNYTFLSEDAKWKLNLTREFLAISTAAYTRWEEFANRLDGPLAHFLRLYKPDGIERIGLRYLNAFSRKALGCEGTPWAELIMPAYLGVLFEEDVREPSVIKCATDVDMALAGNCRLHLHAGPGMLRRGKEQDAESRFILDLDLSASGKIATNQSAQVLQMLHQHADRIFNGAVSDELHDLMEPM